MRCISQARQLKYGKKLVDFKKDIDSDEDIIKLRKEVEEYAETLSFYDE